MSEEPILHIYPHLAHHQEVYIQGNTEGLRRLVNAVQRMVSTKQTVESDGEGYNIVVVLKDSELKEWTKVAVPYIKDYAKEHRSDAVWPWEGEKK